METLHCPTCLSRLVDGREKLCPVCRAAISRRARPLPLIERELQARIEAKTASNLRQRRRAAKVARRIAALPPTIYQRDPAVPAPAAVAPRATSSSPPTAPTFIDLPATSVHEVRSTRTAVEPIVERVVAEPVVERVVAEPKVSAPPVAEPPVVQAPVVEPPIVERVVEIVPPSSPKRRRRRQPVAPIPDEETVEVEPIVALVPDPEPFSSRRRTPPAAPKRRAESTRRFEPTEVPRPAPVVEPAAAKPPIPSVQPAPISRIGERGVNPVWRDRVFNSRRPVDPARWPRPVAPREVDRGRDSAANRYGNAAG